MGSYPSRVSGFRDNRHGASGTGMKLISKYLPEYSFREVHFREVAASPETVIEAAANYSPEADPFFRKMIGLRELPMRLGNRLRGKPADSIPPFGLHNFVPLGRVKDSELAYGLIGRFWRPDFGLEIVPDSQAYLDFAMPGFAKLALGFSAITQQNGTTRLTTETRVFCPDLACRLKFAPYWYLIRPISGLIRSRILTSIQKAGESSLPAVLPRKL